MESINCTEIGLLQDITEFCKKYGMLSSEDFKDCGEVKKVLQMT